ncbi:MAG: MinD/ParA family protein [Lentisphaeria bacterium]|nr:MinD/ParA family protein [Lentisphaeria bacterium]NQZ70034.1 MinD/ParA family protein [Lentisphaeria bacterium]
MDQAASLRLAAASAHLGKLEAKKAISCIAVASGKGGVGKTFFTVNLAIAMHQLNKRVLIVDADLGLANADIILGVNPKFSLQDAIFRGKALSEIVVETPYGVDLIAASSGSREMVSMGETRISMIIQDLLRFASNYDVLIFDCSSGIHSDVTAFLKLAPMNLIVANPTPTSIMDVYALLKIIHQSQICDNPGLIVNMCDSEDQGKKVEETLNKVAKLYLQNQLVLLGTLPRSKHVNYATSIRKPVMALNENEDICRRFRDIAKTVLHKDLAKTKLGELPMDGLVKDLINAERKH